MIYPIHKFFLISFRGVAGRAMGCAIDHHPHQVKIPQWIFGTVPRSALRHSVSKKQMKIIFLFLAKDDNLLWSF